MKKPNLVFVFGDQHRAQSVGYLDPQIKTPCLDWLHSVSIDFENAVSGMPVCAPYRASLMTGQHPLTHGVWLNDLYLDDTGTPFAGAFNGAGYDTAYIGKWHIDGNGREAYIPESRRKGFKFWRVLECTHDYNNSPYYGDGEQKLKWEGYDAFAQTECAKDYIINRDRSRPFALFLSYGPPHDPYLTAPEKYRNMYRPQDIKLRPNVPEEWADAARLELSGYYAHITALDDAISGLIGTLREQGLEQDTVFVYTSDHGDMLRSHGHFNKQRPWDESIRVPFLLRYPALFQDKPRTVGYTIDAPDVYPTLAGLCGVSIPASVEGFDYSPLLRGEKDTGKPPEAAVLSMVTPFGLFTEEYGGREFRGIRTERYTYVHTLQGPWLMYDNKADPYQLDNLIGKPEFSGLQESLDRLLNKRLKETRDEFLPGGEYVKRAGYVIRPNRVYRSFFEKVPPQ